MKHAAPKHTIPSLSLLSRLSEWSGWEYLYEERRRVSAFVFLGVCILLGFGWLLSKRESSSLSKLLRAEVLTEKITAPNDDVSPQNIQEDANTLFSLAETKEVFTRFCGIIAQESVLSKNKSLEKPSFHETSTQLAREGSPSLETLAHITLLQENGETEKALHDIETLLSQSPSPWLKTYLLLQKAFMLQKLGQPNLSVIEELKTVAKNAEGGSEFFHTWLRQNENDFFDSLVKN